jgi:hypothetical protein
MRKVEMASYNLTFAHDYAVVITSVDAENEDQAYTNAVELVKEYYGWDISFFSLESCEEQ